MPQGLDPNLLQAFEHTLETLKRTTGVLRSTLDAMDRCETLSDAVIADYRQQLDAVEKDRERLEAMLGVLWTHMDEQ